MTSDEILIREFKFKFKVTFNYMKKDPLSLEKKLKI
jgi:hypothetical protein